METKQFFDDLQAKLGKVLDESPAKDIEKNVKALLTQGFAKLDLVTREEFDAQALQLTNIRARLDKLEKRIEELEAQLRQAQVRH
ncbi:MAG: accessory factor UbiK family protein [Burkholderiaceae bacterium]|nr:accessory factor UbiK family protein [Burkholderiaceae bacterium]